MKKCVILVGPPCSGKSTIGKMLADTFGCKYVSSGDIARKMAEADGDMRNLDAGKMAPESRMREEISSVLYQNENLILDGFPRFTDQLDWLIERYDGKIIFVIVDVSITQLFKRAVSRDRSDDVAIHERVMYYVKNTIPMIDQINSRQLPRCTVDNSSSANINNVWRTVKMAVKEALNW